MIYTIGEAAKKLKVAPSTLRYYDKEGLIPFVERSGSGIRMFKDDDILGLELIDCLKRTGMPIKDIKTFIDYSMEGDSTIEQRLDIIKEQHASVIKQMEEMQSMLNMLSYKLWYYQTAKEAGTCSIHNDMKKEDIPEEFLKYTAQNNLPDSNNIPKKTVF